MNPHYHVCQARKCAAIIPRKLLMCLRHWNLVPHEMQQQIYFHYRPGQEEDLKLSPGYRQAYQDAVEAVEQIERS